MKNKLYSLFNNYLMDANISDFKGWEEIEVFLAPSLSEAWLQARPHDAIKFENISFKTYVDGASGKWLEKETASEPYKILLSTRYCHTDIELLNTFIHELRHCLDYQNAVKYLEFDQHHTGNDYYNNWSEFRSVMAEIRFNIFVASKNCTSNKELFDVLSGLQGQWNADCIEGLVRSDTLHDKLYYISRYIGASRAIRNLSTEYQLKSSAFQLWNMMPVYIYENFGNVFYIGNEWDNTPICLLNQIPYSYYYEDLLRKIRQSNN